MLRITKYAQRLIDELDTLDWPEGIKLLQKNWIGRSEGAEVHFDVGSSTLDVGRSESVTVFTTRPDTLFGATYMVLAPEHPLVDLITTPEQSDTVESYKKACASKSDLDRGDLNKDKSGVATGAHAINPVNGEKIPVWIADYVMMGYGTGAIMAVPAHDERDFEFATKFELSIIEVVAPADDPTVAAVYDRRNEGQTATDTPEADGHRPTLQEAFPDHGIAINSGFLDGLPTKKAKATMIDWLEKEGKGRRKIQYKLRDWLFSRQRYWGEPFPILWKDGKHEALPESELPLLAPPLEDYKPSGTPDPLLSKAAEWVNLPDGATRETNTMPQWAGSCWYYLRYCDPNNAERFISEEADNYWSTNKAAPPTSSGQANTPQSGMVDLYVGGTEHAVLHLLYARFWHKVLHDLGHVSTVEPFQKLVNQGLILGEDGQKMSKSRGNVVNPDDVVKDYGADALRLYEMFMGPLEQVKPWQMKGVEGVSRFLARVWRVAITDEGEVSPKIQDPPQAEECTDKELKRIVHETIKKVGEDIEKLSFNTAISQMMICTNAFTNAEAVPKAEFIQFLKVLNPFAPHLAEELNAQLGGTEPLSEQAWPTCDEAALVQSTIELVVQVNGKLRARLQVDKDADEKTVKAAALADEKVKEQTDGKAIRKVIYIPGKIFNVVAN